LKPEFRDTKIRASIAWLERAGFLQRNHNLTEAFQGKPLVDSLEAATAIMDRLNITSQTKHLWLGILQQIINSPEDRGIRADELAEALFPKKRCFRPWNGKRGRRPPRSSFRPCMICRMPD
jgi:hypothetical protein